MTTLRCGRIDAHEPHDWSRPPGWSRPRRTYHCEGTPAVIEGGHFAEDELCGARVGGGRCVMPAGHVDPCGQVGLR